MESVTPNFPKKEANIKEDIIRKAKDIVDDFKDYTDGIRVLIFIHRPKEGGKDGGYKATIKRVVTKNRKEFYDEFVKLLDEKERSPEIPYRIYSAVNPRDMKKAIHLFKQEQLNTELFDEESRNGFYFDIKNRFVSALMTPQARDGNLFLWDVDDDGDRDVMGEMLKILPNESILKQYKTKNGWHIVTKPFNHTLYQYPKTATMKKDALLLLAY